MLNRRLLMVLGAAMLATSAGVCAGESPADGQIDRLRLQFNSGNLGLKPQSRPTQGLELPYGINYSNEAKTFLMPIDPRSEWGIGLDLTLNLSAPRTIEMAPSSALGLQPKRTPGVTFQLQRKF